MPSLETMESIARALEVEIEELFEFAHFQAGGVKAEEIEKLLEGADDEYHHEDHPGGGAVNVQEQVNKNP